MKDPLYEALERLALNSGGKRNRLLHKAWRRSRASRALTLLSGLLALFSAGTITAVLTDLLGTAKMQILAAVAAGISGVVSLIVATYFDDRETAEILAGATKYLSLREKAYGILLHPSISKAKLHSKLVELQAEYAGVDEIFARHFEMGFPYNTLSISQVNFRADDEEIRLVIREEISKLQSAVGNGSTPARNDNPDTAPHE